MREWSEFEEKEYESALYAELLVGSKQIRPWTPGQVLEHQLGFDAALFVANSFWSGVGRPASEGVRLARYGLSPMLQRLTGSEENPSEELPDFALNLFVQAKRPSVYRDPPEKVRNGGITAPSFFFDVTLQQQAILDKLAEHLGPKADVTYACAAFMKKRELFALPSIVAHSSFPPAAKLKSHERWYYNRGGADGVAHSDPEPIQAPGLLDRLGQNARQHPRALVPWYRVYEGELSKEDLDVEIARRVDAMVPHLGHLWDAFSTALGDLPAEYAPPAGAILEQARSIDEKLPEHVRLVVQISTVAASLDLAWLVVGPEGSGDSGKPLSS